MPEPAIRFDPDLNTDVRSGGLSEQATSTYDLFADAVHEGRLSDAAALARYAIQEAREAKELFLEWRSRTQDLLFAAADAGAVKRAVAALRARVEHGLTAPLDGEAEWKKFCLGCEAAAEACQKGHNAKALDMLERTRSDWLEKHDRLCDWVQGMVGLYAEFLGEDRIGELWQDLMAPMIGGYDRYDTEVRPWSVSARILLFITAEALRGHLSGPGRRGGIEFLEEETRIGFRFRPCGSGGRNMTGETHGSYPVTTRKHDWAWNTKGVCLYCAHCCVLSEVNPIRRLGYPAREVEPPFENANGRRTYCTWWVYRDPSLVPEHVYARTGHVKPEKLAGRRTIPK